MYYTPEHPSETFVIRNSFHSFTIHTKAIETEACKFQTYYCTLKALYWLEQEFTVTKSLKVFANLNWSPEFGWDSSFQCFCYYRP